MFSVEARSADGKGFTSDDMFESGWKGGTDGHEVRIDSNAATLTVPQRTAVDKAYLRLWFRSFKSFRNGSVKTPLGGLLVQGQAADVEIDDVTGSVTIVAPTSNPGADWFSQADALLDHMHNGLAFAHGGRLQTPRIDKVHNQTAQTTFFRGDGFQSEFAVQHALNQRPFIDALVHRYFDRGPLEPALWTALGWMQIETTFDEVRFLTGMTALETLIESQLPQQRGTTVPKPQFKELRGTLEAAIASASNLTDLQREILLRKVRGLNMKTLREKMSELIQHYAIPQDDLDDQTLLSLIDLRNDIVHRGAKPAGMDIWPAIILVREFITRILLREIGFKGRYCCYIGGRHDREFA